MGRRRSSLACLLYEVSPPPALFLALTKNWALGVGDDEAPETAGRLSRTAVDLAVRSRAKTGWMPHESFCMLAGIHAKGVDQLTFFVVDRYSFVSLLLYLFDVARGKYEEGLGNPWAVKGGIPVNILPTLVNLTPLHFALNSSL